MEAIESERLALSHIVGISVSEERAIVEKFLKEHPHSSPVVVTTENEMPLHYQNQRLSDLHYDEVASGSAACAILWAAVICVDQHSANSDYTVIKASSVHGITVSLLVIR